MDKAQRVASVLVVNVADFLIPFFDISAQAKVTSEEKDGNTQITVELLQTMQNIAKTEADKAIMNNFARAGGAFRR